MAMGPDQSIKKGVIKAAKPGKQGKKGNMFMLRTGASKGKMNNAKRGM